MLSEEFLDLVDARIAAEKAGETKSGGNQEWLRDNYPWMYEPIPQAASSTEQPSEFMHRVQGWLEMPSGEFLYIFGIGLIAWLVIWVAGKAKERAAEKQ